MSITAEIVITVAEVDVTDDYRVELRQAHKRETFTPTEALHLADELMAAAARAVDTLRQDFPQPSPEWEAAHHAFDVAPICRDCAEGKHAACIGSAFVERGIDVDEVECGCAAAKHRTIGAAS